MSQQNVRELIYEGGDEDLYRRFKALRLEVNHLKSVVDYYAGDSEQNSFDSAEDIKKIMDFICESASEECESFNLYLEARKSCVGSFGDSKYLVCQSLFRKRKNLLLDSIGYVIDKLSHYFENQQLEDPSPLYRRRKEQGFSLEYLRRLTLNSYRDMVLFLKESMGCEFPYDKVPFTLQFWRYDERNEVDKFKSEEAFSNWLKNVSTNASQSECRSPSGIFNTLKLSYWSIEYSDLYPIIGHEVSHLVVDEICGDLEPHLISDREKTGKFGHLCRNIIKSVYSAMSHKENFYGGIEREILSDCLALVVFKVSYLHAWFLEMLDLGLELRVVVNPHERMECYDTIKNLRVEESTFAGLEKTQRDYDVYIRASILCQIVEANIQYLTDSERIFVRSFKGHVDLLLQHRAEVTGDWDDLNTIPDEIVKAIGDSEFVDILGQYWCYGVSKKIGRNSFYKRKALLTAGAQKKLRKFDEEMFGGGMDCKILKPSNAIGIDFVCRAYWWGGKERILRLKDSVGLGQEVKDYIDLVEEHYSNRRRLTFLIEEDYVFKTGNVGHFLFDQGKVEGTSEILNRYRELCDIDLIHEREMAIAQKRIRRILFESNYGIFHNYPESGEYDWFGSGEFYTLFLQSAKHPSEIGIQDLPDIGYAESQSKLLGRYDYFSLVRTHQKSVEYIEAECDTVKYWRRRSLYRIDWEYYLNGSATDFHTENCTRIPLALISISLHTKGLRRYFPQRFSQMMKAIGEFSDLKVDLFISNSTEDYIVSVNLISLDGTLNSTAQIESYEYDKFLRKKLERGRAEKYVKGFRRMLSYLSEIKIVSKTETIFAKTMLYAVHKEEMLEIAYYIRQFSELEAENNSEIILGSNTCINEDWAAFGELFDKLHISQSVDDGEEKQQNAAVLKAFEYSGHGCKEVYFMAGKYDFLLLKPDDAVDSHRRIIDSAKDYRLSRVHTQLSINISHPSGR